MRAYAAIGLSVMVFLGTYATAQTLPGADRPLAERFANPPAESRILPIVHRLPDAPEQQDAMLRGMLEKGFGGMATNVPFDNYLESDAMWQTLVRAVTEAKKAGMSLWLYDEKGYPSGNAGGLTMRDHPEWEARGLLVSDAVCEGGPVSLDVPPGTLVRAAAFPVKDGAIDLDRATDLSAFVKDRTFTWNAPAGSWQVMVITEDYLYEGTHAAVSLADKLPYINLLMPEPTARFLEVTHERYAQHLGDDLGKYFVSTFTDEPSLMSMFMRPQPWRVLPWSPNLAPEFEKRRGYALAPVLPALCADTGPKGLAARHDFWLTVGELVAENYFGQIQDWCKPHNILSGGHLLFEESIVMHVPLYGDFYRSTRRVDAPSIDCLTSVPEEVPWYIARLIGSVADLEGRPVTMCEVSDHSQRYRPAGDERPVRIVTEDEIRGTLNRLMLNGINTMTSYYVFKDLTNDQLLRLNEWTGRCCTMLKGGRQVTDVALVYPIESVWVQFEPARRMVMDAPAGAHRVERSYTEASEDLYTSGRDFTYLDSKALCDAQVEQGILKLNGMAWRAVVLPAVDTLPLKAWKNLGRFWREGGIVIALTARPANSEKEFPAPAVQALAEEIFGTQADAFNTNPAGGCGVFLPRGSVSMLPIVLDALIGRDVQVSNPAAPIRATHRVVDGNQIYFVINDSRAPWEGSLTFAASGKGEQWEPATGQQTPVDPAQPIALKLAPFGGVLFRFDEAKSSQRHAVPAQNVDVIQWSALPQISPIVVAGEFVKGKIESIPPGNEHGLTWSARGVLTQSEVDTFLFAIFDYPQPMDLSKSAFVGFTTEIPRAQNAGKPLLLVVRDVHGTEGLAQTQQSLDEPGITDILVRLNRIETAGWNQSSRRAVDLTAITSIRLGWGGHYGAANDIIEFALSPPRLGSLTESE
ncbi:MAG: glycosyl hydrolase [FCB group bacterium]|jgi:hypothetical protein|nr:glycosyl hydrolase [FCB group bacterium]